MSSTKTETHKPKIVCLLQVLRRHHRCGKATILLFLTFLLLSVLSGLNYNQPRPLYLAGDIAQIDVVADKDFFVEDNKGTQERIDKAVLLQPPIYDLTISPYLKFQEKLVTIIRILNNGKETRTAEEEHSLKEFEDGLTTPLYDEILPELAKTDVQNVLLKQVLPFILQKMSTGLVSDIRQTHVGRSGIMMRDLDTGRDILRPELTSLDDVHSMLAEISVRLRQITNLQPQSRRALNLLLSTLLPPASLTLNQEATKRHEEDIRNSVDPVLYHIQKGEILVRKGEKVSREQYLKLQSFNRTSETLFAWDRIFGAFLCATIMAIGFFVSPSGKPGTPLYAKDILLISLLLLLMSLGAIGTYILVMRMEPTVLPIAITLFPVASVVGLTSTIFAARRYCTMSLLCAFFATLLLHAPWQVFLFYFLGSLLFTWLVVTALSREDTAWSIVPLTIGQIIIWLAIAFVSQFPTEYLMPQIIAAITNSVLSLFILFAISPILELVFKYSTRFKLMELMSLEQPLMQKLMVSAPGTYHHSLIVANMVEAGAKAIGANSLLCKVAALYHDIGKTHYPEYFIENQFGGPNRHDKLAPSMSALVLHSHVKKGVEMAREHGLGQDICDIIQQHHGTRLMFFFYQKALKMGEKVTESEFCYPGPRPQTKESAIIMLADSVEASSRTLTDPTPARIKSHIDKIVKGIFAEGQLDESELTFKDLHYLSENFQRILTGIFHQRIAYPETKKPAPHQETGKTGEQKSSAHAQTQAQGAEAKRE
ncbi:MAG: HDIG domain-containing protein [Desulfovibrionaceae bacterium]|nr:HDIG domain-containing protein [Desulfovibrionaceae bacterium]